MVKSLLSGGIFGGVIAVVGAGVVSLVAPPPNSDDSFVEPMIAISEIPSEPSGEDIDVVVSEPTEEVAEISKVPVVTVPEADDTDEFADTEPLDQPDAGLVSVELDAPSENNISDVATNSEDPILPNPQSIAPQVPINDESFDVASAEPDLSVEEVAKEPTADTEPDNSTIEDDNTSPEAVDEDNTAPTTQDLVAPNEIENDEPIVVAIISEDKERSLPGANSGVKVNRTLGSEPTTDVSNSSGVESTLNAPAIEQFAAQFEGGDNKPTMSVILLHNENTNDGPALVSSLSFPVTVVLDTDTENASDLLAGYRDAGIEVAVSTTFPRRATPGDIEIAMEAAFGLLPETVALVDIGEGGLQSNRNVTRQAVEALAADGRGLVTISKGLNSAIREAESVGVPSGVIFRDLDVDGQDARIIRRFLDQAAFRARQDSGVILLARVRPETIDALNEWGSANRAGQVALAPLSTVLTSN